MLKQTTNVNVSVQLRAIFRKSLENWMILRAALSRRFLLLLHWCGERCSLSLCFSRGPWLVGVVFRPSVAVVNGRRFRPTFGHLECTSMSNVIGTATIWQPSELSVEERNLLSSANQSFSVSMDSAVRTCTFPRPCFVVKHDQLSSEMRNVRAYFYDVTTRMLCFSAGTSERFFFMMLPRRCFVLVLERQNVLL